jgi:hypothetical protein
VRDHGIPGFTDPVLGANGQVFTDTRPLQDAPKDTQDAARHDLVSQANWNPEQQSPAPAALVAAGVKAAQCMRQHGLPNYRDPSAQSPYTPGHGFGIRPEDLPQGSDKGTPAVQQAAQACRSLLDEEIKASALERRGEVGLRRALGATRATVGLLFLIESTLLCLLGAVAGAAVGVAATVAFAAASGIPPVLPWPPLAAGLTAALLIGVLAGLYPATRAARLSPTDALRTP